MHDQINCKKSPTGSLPPAVPLAITPTFRPLTHTSDDSYMYQLSFVVATATVSFIFGPMPESDIPPIYRATRRYTKIHLGVCLRFSTLIGQIGRVPLFGAGPRRYIRSRLFRLAVTAFWRALTAFWRQNDKRKQRSFLGPLARQNCLRIVRP